MQFAELNEHRVIGHRRDGWAVVVTAEIIGDTNTFETKRCLDCRVITVRPHDAETWRIERENKRARKA